MTKYFFLFLLPLFFLVAEIQLHKNRIRDEKEIVMSQINKNCGENIQLIRHDKDRYYSFVCNDYGFEFYKQDDGQFVGFWENTQTGDELYTFSDKEVLNNVISFWHIK